MYNYLLSIYALNLYLGCCYFPAMKTKMIKSDFILASKNNILLLQYHLFSSSFLFSSPNLSTNACYPRLYSRLSVPLSIMLCGNFLHATGSPSSYTSISYQQPKACFKPVLPSPFANQDPPYFPAPSAMLPLCWCSPTETMT